jgi:hypothetical protein
MDQALERDGVMIGKRTGVPHHWELRDWLRMVMRHKLIIATRYCLV